MERDFTAKAYYDFRILIDELQDDGWLDVRDWFGDLYLSLKHLLQNWGVLDRTTEINTYYRELLDRKDASRRKIAQVFLAIAALDSTFTDPHHFGYPKQQVNYYRQCLNDLIEYIGMGHHKGSLTPSFNPGLFDRLSGKISPRLLALSLPLPEHQFTASSFWMFSKKKKEAYISRCEELCPELAEKVNSVFSDPDFTDREKRDIKFLIYSAPEPYRSIYLKYIDQYDVALYQDKSEHGGKKFNSFHRSGEIWLTDEYSTLRGNPRSPYNTFFHESGHAIDYYETPTYLSTVFELDDERLYDCIVKDVRTYVSNYMNNTEPYSNLTDAQKNLLLTSLNLSGDASFGYEGSINGLSKPLQEYRDNLISAMSEDLDGETNESPSDVFGGVTNNAIIGDYGHRKDEDETPEEFTYWYSKDGDITKAQAQELWAEFFAAQMTHDEEALASINEHFPTAYPMLEEMAQKMTEP